MLNLQTLMKPYKFRDGDKEYTLNQPTQEMFLLYTSQNKPENIIDYINDLFDSLLKEEDASLKALPVQVKLVIIRDYFEYHSKNLNSFFPSRS